MRIKNTVPNPIAGHIFEELQPVVDAVYAVTEAIGLEIDRPVGIEHAEDGGYRPSTDDECRVVGFSFSMECHIDPCKPIFNQLSAWLKECADQIDEARNEIERIEGIRDTVVLPRKQRSA
jgi:hypothetical protein